MVVDEDGEVECELGLDVEREFEGPGIVVGGGIGGGLESDDEAEDDADEGFDRG